MNRLNGGAARPLSYDRSRSGVCQGSQTRRPEIRHEGMSAVWGDDAADHTRNPEHSPWAVRSLDVRPLREWVCPECDYFEEVEAGED